MKIAILTGSVSRRSGGLFTSVRRISQCMAKCNDIQICVFSLKDEFTHVDAQKWAPLRLRSFTTFHFPCYAWSFGLKKVLLDAQVDLLHLHGIWAYTAYAALAWQQRTRRHLLISPRGMLDSWALKNSAWKKKIAGWLYENRNLRYAACIHALCESEYQSIRAYGLKSPVCIIPNGIDLPDLSIEKKPPPWNSQIGADKNVMLFFGRIHPKKGLENLIRAWGVLKTSRLSTLDNWHLIVAGWGQKGHEDQLKQFVREMNIEGDVSFTGPLYDTAKDATFRAAKAFILPSFSEGLPMAVLEAWAYGLPVIMTRECNTPEGFEAKAALDIQPNVGSIVEGLRSFLGLSEGTRGQMGQRGLELVRSRFTWSRIAAQMIDVYKWILGQGDKPGCVYL